MRQAFFATSKLIGRLTHMRFDAGRPWFPAAVLFVFAVIFGFEVGNHPVGSTRMIHAASVPLGLIAPMPRPTERAAAAIAPTETATPVVVQTGDEPLAEIRASLPDVAAYGPPALDVADYGPPAPAADLADYGPPAPAADLADYGPPAPEPPRVISEGSLAEGDTLARAMNRLGVSAGAVHRIAAEMAPVFNFRYSRPGDRFRLEQDPEGTVLAFRYERSPLERYTLHRLGDDYVAARHEPEFVRRRTRIAGVVTSSLYEAIDALGEKTELANDFANIFAWDLDFAHAVQPGDEFAMVYERLFIVDEEAGEEVYVRPGRILAARYNGRHEVHEAVYFQSDETRGGYYRLDGSAVERQMLKAPLKYHRISSSYSLSRLHPVLKVRRPHQGIDYAAPIGTSVWAVADGKVLFAGWSGGFGNLVKVQHKNGYVSYYGHLSGFAPGLVSGGHVSQKQVIGYVGSTGLSTGPHLDFRLRKNGRYVNPASIRTPSGPPIPDALNERFADTRDALLGVLDPPSLVVVQEAL